MKVSKLKISRETTLTVQEELKEQAHEVQRLKESCRDMERKCAAWEKVFNYRTIRVYIYEYLS